MKIVVIGGTGLIGSKVVALLETGGHQVVAASPKSGVNAVTGEGLAEALAGAQVVVDVTNSPSFEEKAVMEFFTASTRNLLQAETSAGVGHHVALSIVGTQGLPENPYFRAKIAQENQIAACGRPYTIVQATQFFEFIGSIADLATQGSEVRVPPVLIQPMAAGDVAAAVAQVAVDAPLNGTVEVAGPEALPMDELMRLHLAAAGPGDQRTVVVDPAAGYYGAPVRARSLVPAGQARLGTVRYADWLKR